MSKRLIPLLFVIVIAIAGALVGCNSQKQPKLEVPAADWTGQPTIEGWKVYKASNVSLIGPDDNWVQRDGWLWSIGSYKKGGLENGRSEDGRDERVHRLRLQQESRMGWREIEQFQQGELRSNVVIADRYLRVTVMSDMCEEFPGLESLIQITRYTGDSEGVVLPVAPGIWLLGRPGVYQATIGDAEVVFAALKVVEKPRQ